MNQVTEVENAFGNLDTYVWILEKDPTLHLQLSVYGR